MDIFYKTLAKRYKTKKTGVYYKEIEKTSIDAKGKIKLSISDKVYSIQYKDINNTWRFKTIGKHSEGIREAYCNQKRIEIMNLTRLGEQPPIIENKKKKTIITFDEVASKYFESVQDVNRDYKTSKTRYNLHIKPTIGKLDIFGITYKHIEKIQKAKQKTHSPKTVNHIITLVGTIFNYAIQKEDIKIISPMNKIKSLKIDNKRERFLSVDEIEALLFEVKDNDTLNLFTRLSLSTGGRLATVFNIKKKDVNLSNHTINLYDFKNGTSYKGFLTDNLIPIIANLLPQLKINDNLISGYAADTIQHKMKKILDKLFNEGLESNDAKNRAVTHTLRHTFASQLAMNGTPIFTIQKLMNHKDINMTLRYAKLAPDNGKNEVKGLYKT